MSERQTIVIAAPGVLEGPHAEIQIGEINIQIWCRIGHKARIARHHGKVAREAAEKRQPYHPNPCVVPIDDGEDGRHYVFAKITVDENATYHRNLSLLGGKR